MATFKEPFLLLLSELYNNKSMIGNMDKTMTKDFSMTKLDSYLACSVIC